MPFWLKKIAVSFVLLLVGGGLLAQIIDKDRDRINLSGGSIYTAVPFLLISPDARGGSMGNIGVASSPDINSQHWNAAKYAFMNDFYGVSLTYSPWLRSLVPDMNLLYLAGYWRLKSDWVIASSLRYFSLGKVTFRSGPDDPGMTFMPNEYALDGSLSRKLSENFSLAVTGRYIRSDLTNGYSDPHGGRSSAANSGAVDVSMFYTQSILTPNTEASSFALGMNISNIGAKISYSESMKKEFLPTNLRLGGSYTVQIDRYNEFTGLIDFNKLLVPTPPLRIKDSIIAGMDDNVGVIQGIFQSFHDAPGGWREEFHEINISVGIEYWYNQTVAFRGGYFHESGGVRRRDEHGNTYRLYPKGGRQYFTLGAGLRFNVFEVEFSYLMPRARNIPNPLKNTLRFTLKFNFAEYRRNQNQQTTIQN